MPGTFTLPYVWKVWCSFKHCHTLLSIFIILLCLNRDPTGEWEYEMPFDLNMKDVTGQNVLYVASFLGNYKMVELLLKFRVKASRIKASLINDHYIQCPKLHC